MSIDDGAIALGKDGDGKPVFPNTGHHAIDDLVIAARISHIPDQPLGRNILYGNGGHFHQFLTSMYGCAVMIQSAYANVDDSCGSSRLLYEEVVRRKSL